MSIFDAWDARDAARRNGQKPTAPPPTVGVPPGSADRYTTKALDGLARTVAGAAEGSRNDTLNWAAYTAKGYIVAGHLDQAVAWGVLADAARAAGLPDDEIHRTLTSGFSADAPPKVIPPRDDIPPAAAFTHSDHGSATDGDEERRRTSWWPRDLTAALTGYDSTPAPSHLARDDGHRLLYPGKVNALLGESESGKTWVALLAVAQALMVAEHVVYLDFEDSATGIVSRLRSMGCTDTQLAGLAYIGPDEAFHHGARIDLHEALGDLEPSLVVLDGVNAAMTLMGLDLMSNRDATAFTQILLRPLSRTGASVATIDHLPKAVESRGKGGIGAQAKRADVDGCSLGVEVVQPFGRGMSGRLKLTVDKDRPGHVRAVSAFARQAGVAALESLPDGSVRIRVEAPDLRPADEREPFEPTHLMEAVSRLLESVQQASLTAIHENVTGKEKAIDAAVARLVEKGYVGRESGPRNSILHRSIEPYREGL